MRYTQALDGRTEGQTAMRNAASQWEGDITGNEGLAGAMPKAQQSLQRYSTDAAQLRLITARILIGRTGTRHHTVCVANINDPNLTGV